MKEIFDNSHLGVAAIDLGPHIAHPHLPLLALPALNHHRIPGRVPGSQTWFRSEMAGFSGGCPLEQFTAGTDPAPVPANSVTTLHTIHTGCPPQETPIQLIAKPRQKTP